MAFAGDASMASAAPQTIGDEERKTIFMKHATEDDEVPVNGLTALFEELALDEELKRRCIYFLDKNNNETVSYSEFEKWNTFGRGKSGGRRGSLGGRRGSLKDGIVMPTVKPEDKPNRSAEERSHAKRDILKAAFDMYDEKGTGVLDRSELRDVFQHLGWGSSESQIDDLLKYVHQDKEITDESKKQTVDFSEFLKWHEYAFTTRVLEKSDVADVGGDAGELLSGQTMDVPRRLSMRRGSLKEGLSAMKAAVAAAAAEDAGNQLSESAEAEAEAEAEADSV